MIDVTTTSSDDQLTTTAAVKLVLATTLTSDDALINSLITRASRWAEQVVGYPLSAAAYRETVPSYGSRRLMLSRSPVRAVTGFWSATDTGTATTFLTSEYRLDREPGFVDRDAGWAWDTPDVPKPFSFGLAQDPWSGQERSPWMLDYVAGYTYGGLTTAATLYSTAKGTTSTGRTLPEDIEEAVIRKVAAWYEGSDNVVEQSVGDLRIRYGSFGSGRISDPALELLEPYRRVA